MHLTNSTVICRESRSSGSLFKRKLHQKMKTFARRGVAATPSQHLEAVIRVLEVQLHRPSRRVRDQVSLCFCSLPEVSGL